jgi:hypothetical protein
LGLALASGGHGADFLSKVGDGGANELVGGRVFLPRMYSNSFKLIRNIFLPVSHDRKHCFVLAIQTASGFVIAKVAGSETACCEVITKGECHGKRR